MSGLLVSLKDKVGADLKEPDLANAFRQVENWANKTQRNAFFQLRQSGALTVPNGGAVLSFNTIDYDTDHGFNGTTTYTIPPGQTGLWCFSTGIQWANNGVGTRQLSINPQRFLLGNTSFTDLISAAVDGLGRQVVTTLVFCQAGDTTTVTGFQSSGGNLNTVAGLLYFVGSRVASL